jgi:hypothetical protein
MPVRVGGRLSPRQRWLLLGALVLFALSQVALALAPGRSLRSPPAAATPSPPATDDSGPTTDD